MAEIRITPSSHIIKRFRHCSFSVVLCRKICKGGLQKLLIRYDTEDHSRHPPIYFMYEKLGLNFCSNLLNVYILTGYGTYIKVVPKKCNKSKATPIRGVLHFL